MHSNWRHPIMISETPTSLRKAIGGTGRDARAPSRGPACDSTAWLKVTEPPSFSQTAIFLLSLGSKRASDRRGGVFS